MVSEWFRGDWGGESNLVGESGGGEWDTLTLQEKIYLFHTLPIEPIASPPRVVHKTVHIYPFAIFVCMAALCVAVLAGAIPFPPPPVIYAQGAFTFRPLSGMPWTRLVILMPIPQAHGTERGVCWRLARDLSQCEGWRVIEGWRPWRRE